MLDYESAWPYVRPDAVTVWKDPSVLRSLSWYRRVMLNEAPAKFIIVKKVECPEEPSSVEELSELWRVHDKLVAEFRRLWKRVKEGSEDVSKISTPERSFLDVKIEIARRMLRSCEYCERRCKVNREEGKTGACRMRKDVVVHSWFLHIGEEAPLVPSGTIFYGGCNFRCVYCQNYDISQENPYGGVTVTPAELAKLQRELRKRGARNINHVGGDPTPHIHGILESLRYLEVNTPQLWNSNMYLTQEAMKLLVDVIDIWLPDLKYGNNECALRLSGVPGYFEVATRNLQEAVKHGDMIIRHLVLPQHLECCTKRVLEWIAKNLPKERVLVNIMEQYRPEFLVARHPHKWPEISRRLKLREIEWAYEYAEKLGIVYKPVS